MMNRTWWILVVAAIALLGCGGGLKSKVVGTWKFDTNSLQMPGLTDAMKKSPQFSQLSSAFEAARLEFKSDGTYQTTGMGAAETGKWELNDHTVTMKSDKGDDKNNPTLTVDDSGTKIHASGPAPSGQGQMTMDLVKA